MISKERKRWIYETMNRIRYFELKVQSLFEQDKLRGSVHLYVGEEAVAATLCSLLRDEDYITSTHRGHGHCIAKGARMDKAMAELMGKATGYCKGRSGSMHIADFTKGNLGANAIVGGGIPIATGAALAAKLRGTDQVAVSFFGDGASNQGTFHESLNLAGVWKLPVIYVCENNGFGISVPTWQSTSVGDISVRGTGYNIPGFTVDGNDVYAIYEVAEQAIIRAKAGEGPTLIECKTYRHLGHWTGDPQPYRTREEVEKWKQENDPIRRMRERMLQEGDFTPEELDEIERAAIQEADDAAEFALNSPEPDPATLMEDVFYEGVQ
ncbi:thiamine pyrophosphate-dependent dehydrogenase E1 component subunit alpha [Zhaonella formicivorans]|jgi:pyruvate dehydrogenase E1 component alpha subunit|uniref:thiamine pyrophosphate-dependent dehydrogenase E1 component subunit alpha n=1 Tax=Zhaonella formicivorans TaxID=2528593 RepID=UPI0010EF717C|nr:thiamine pyrophosphate-dependent dehydrogenase E1 component subunit alpha [Zhaonella formicivorans]